MFNYDIEKDANLRKLGSEKKLSVISEPGYPRLCQFCNPFIEIQTSYDFGKHIRSAHTTQEGGSFLCRYGENGVCQKLPLEGVCDLDFEAHIRRCHTANFEPYTDSEDGLSLRSVRLTSETPTELSEQRKFSLTSFTQNLSAVLADPGRSRNETANFFTRHWGESFVPQATIPSSRKVPKVTKKVIEEYNETTGESYNRYRSVRRALRLSHGEGGTLCDEKQDADDLPTIFIDPRFTLSDPETFSAVFTIPQNENADALRRTLSGRNVVPATPLEISKNSTPGSFRDYESLQTRLEMMHDVVDGRLASKLVSKTDSFWQVVRSYSGLQEQLAVAMKSIKDVRSHLKEVDELVCKQSTKIVQIHGMYEQKRSLLTKLQDIACLREAQSTVQMMLSQGDYPKAIECIETSLDVLTKDLNGVTCFRHLASQLRELYDVIGRMMNEDFASLIQRELGVKPEPGILIQAEGELSAVLFGLMRMRRYTFIEVLREEIIEGVKKVMRQVIKVRILESGLDLSEFDPSLTQLGEPVRRMKHHQFLETIQAVMNEQFEFCKRLEALQELLIEIAEKVSKDAEFSDNNIGSECSKEDEEVQIRKHIDNDSDQEDEESDVMTKSGNSSGVGITIGSAFKATATTLMSIDVKSESFLRRILPLISEFGHQCAQQRISRLLIARAKNALITESTTPVELSEVIFSVKQYQAKCESQGWYSTQNARSGALGRAINKLSMDYIEKFHASRKVRIGNMLDTELWKAAEVSPSDRAMIDLAVETGVLRHAETVKISSISNNKTVIQRGESTTTIDSISQNAGTNKIVIGNTGYVVVGSCITMVQILADYCEAIREMPNFAQDWNSRIIELLKTFNSRCCQLILGAGALQLVGLKTISVRNLALAGRSLELICKFIPIVHNEMDRVLSEDRKHLLRHFKQVEAEYKDHVNEIALKLISVIDHYTTQCLGMWEVNGTIPSPEFQQICKHMSKFHNGLTGIMPSDQIGALFQKVHENFKANLKEHLVGMGITPHDPLKYGYVTKDYMFYQQSMKLMESCRDLELESLNDILYA